MPRKKKLLTKETIRRIRAMIAAILAQPELYNQYTFDRTNECGTEGCAAGWAIWLFDRRGYNHLHKLPYSLETSVKWIRFAVRALDLPLAHIVEIHRLFGTPSQWPTLFWVQYMKATTPAQRAQACAARWEHFIATDGKE